MGGWPMVSGTNWNESAWDWDAAILNMRKSIGKKKYNIFETKKSYNEIDLDDVRLAWNLEKKVFLNLFFRAISIKKIWEKLRRILSS